MSSCPRLLLAAAAVVMLLALVLSGADASLGNLRETRHTKSRPSVSSWYYMMGHPAKRSEELPQDAGGFARAVRGDNDAGASAGLLSEFMTFLSLKESGLLDVCLAIQGQKMMSVLDLPIGKGR